MKLSELEAGGWLVIKSAREQRALRVEGTFTDTKVGACLVGTWGIRKPTRSIFQVKMQGEEVVSLSQLPLSSGAEVFTPVKFAWDQSQL